MPGRGEGLNHQHAYKWNLYKTLNNRVWGASRMVNTLRAGRVVCPERAWKLCAFFPIPCPKLFHLAVLELYSF